MLSLNYTVIGSQWDIDFGMQAARLNLLLGKSSLNGSHILTKFSTVFKGLIPMKKMCAFKYSTSNQKHIRIKSDWLANKVSLKMKQQHDFPLLNLSVHEVIH